MFCFVHSNCKQRPDLGHETRVCFHAVYLCQYQCAKILIPVWDVKHVSVFTLYLVSVSLHWDPHTGLGHEIRVCFHAVPCVSVTALRSSWRIWDMEHMSVFTHYLVSVLLHWDPHNGFGTWNTCLFHAVPCVSVTAMRSSWRIWDMKHMSVFTLYLVSVSLHWDPPSGSGT